MCPHISRVARLHYASSLLTASLRVKYAAACLEARAKLAPTSESDRATPAVAAATAARATSADFLAALLHTLTPTHPHALVRLAEVQAQLTTVLGPGPEDDFNHHCPWHLPSFKHTNHMCLATLWK